MHPSFRVFVVSITDGSWNQIFQSGNEQEAREYMYKYARTVDPNRYHIILSKDIEKITWKVV